MKTRIARGCVVAALVAATAIGVACGGSGDDDEEATPTTAAATASATARPATTPTAAVPTVEASATVAVAPTSPPPPPPANTPVQPPPAQNTPVAPPPPPPTNTPVPPPPPTGVSVLIKALTTAFSPNSATVPAGATVTLTFDNQDEGVMHDFVLYGSGGNVLASTDVATAPNSQTVTFTLTPGQYAFKCSVHPREMTGSITAQ